MLPQNRPECYDHVVGLRAVRRYRDAAITEEDLAAILEAGRWTGSARNRQAWAFVVMSGPEEMARLARAGGAGGPLTHASLAIVLVRLPEGNDPRVLDDGVGQDLLRDPFGELAGRVRIRRLDAEFDVLADAHATHAVEPQRRQRLLDRAPCGIGQSRPQRHDDLEALAHQAPSLSRYALNGSPVILA